MIDDSMNRIKVKRGMDLPQSRLTDEDVRLIRALVEERERHREEAAKLTNAKLAEKFGVHVRTIDKVTAGENWGHVA